MQSKALQSIVKGDLLSRPSIMTFYLVCVGATVVVKKAATSVTEGTQKFLTLAVFWVVFLVAIGLVASS